MKKDVKSGLSKVGQILDIFSPAVDIFFPKAKIPMVLASEVIDKITDVDDKVSKSSIFGITATSIYLDEVINQYNKTGNLDVEKLKLVNNNLKEIDKFIDSSYKVIS